MLLVKGCGMYGSCKSAIKRFLDRYGLSVSWLLSAPKWQTLRLQIRHKCYFQFFLCRNCKASVARLARISLTQNARIYFNQAIPGTAPLPGSLLMQGNAQLVCTGQAIISDGVFIDIHDGGRLEIGELYVNRKLELECRHHIKIGDGVAIGPDVIIRDSDAHRFQGDHIAGAPVIIEDRVWLGARVVVLKGVTIGKGSVIGTGAVVTKSIPPNCLAVGVPARVVKTGIVWRG